MQTHDVAVIGAGLAGLRAAAVLAEHRRDVVVLEAAEVVGGRQRTDDVDGFVLDRGFQVLNPAYPAVRRWVDVEALDLHALPAAIAVHRGRTVAELAHPVRHPQRLADTVRSGLVRPHELAALLRWALPGILFPRAVRRGADRTLRDGWNRVGFHGALRAEVLEPFLAGVVADDSGLTSDAFVRLLVRMFVLGRPGLPAHGIRALPAQLGARASAAGADIRLSHRASELRPHGDATEIAIAGAEPIRARAVLVATGPGDLTQLTGLARPATRGLQTWWFAPDAAPSASAALRVDGRRRGPLVHTTVLSHTVPTYAPPGRHLVEATCLLTPGAEATETEVRRQLGELWRTDATRWPLLRRDDIADALPAQLPPLQTRHRARLGDALWVAGDHRDTASIQGALISGDRVARAVLAASDSPRTGTSRAATG